MPIRRNLRRIAAAAAAGLVGSALAGGCSSSSGGDAALKAQLSQGCTLNTDCNAPLVCAFSRCHNACNTSVDCPPKERCVASEKPNNVCQLAAERTCDFNSQCPGTEVCAVDGICRDQCAADRDCLVGQVCRAATCADPGDLVGDQLPVVPRDGGVDAGTAGNPCALNSDCGGLVCRMGRCAVECKTPSDCNGLACNAGKCAVQDAGAGDGATDGGACTYNSQCTSQNPDFVCRNGACGFECMGPADCTNAKTCSSSHHCIGITNIPDGSPDGYGTSCALNSDCPAVTGGALVCKSGTCVFECNTSGDCDVAKGQCCQNHACTMGTCSDGGTDGGTSDAGGKACVSNDTCDDGQWCNGPEVCFAGHCAPALDTPCNSHTGCIKDTCDEAAKSCTHTMIGTIDKDGDGHLAYACGGDDCNDDDATIYTGAKELCDGKDNDCNTLIDDRSRVPYGPALVGASGNTAASGVGAPLGAGWVIFEAQVGDKNTLMTQLIDGATGMAGPVQQIGGSSNNPSKVFAAAGETSTAAVLWENSTNVIFTIVDATGAATGGQLLASGATDAVGEVLWTGTDYLATYVSQCGGSCPTYGGVGSVQRVSPAGTLGGAFTIPTTAGTGNVIAPHVAMSGATFAVGYSTQVDPMDATTRTAYLIILGQSLSTVAGPIALGKLNAPGNAWPRVLAIGGFAGGYAVAWHDATAPFMTTVATDGTVLGTTALPADVLPGAGTSSGASDGAGAVMFLQEPSSLPLLAYSNGKNPVELSKLAALAKAGGGVQVSSAASGGRVGLFVYSAADQTTRGTAFGCPP